MGDFSEVVNSENGNHNKINVGEKNLGERVEIENKIIKIWEQILDIEPIEIDDNFFDLGGHSLKAIELECVINAEFNVEISLEEIFKDLTIRKLAKHIVEAEKSQQLFIQKTLERQYYPLSLWQKEMFLLNSHDDIGTALNIPFVRKINGKIDVNQFEEAIKKLIERHEILRTSFKLIDEKPVQIVHKEVDFKLMYIQSEGKDPKEIIKDFIRPFDLIKAPLFKAALIKIGTNSHIFVMDMHHIISDGYSLSVILKDIATLYEGNTLADLEIQYKDYCVWQNEALLQSEAYKKAEQFWMDKFKTIPPRLNLPTDFTLNNYNEYSGERIYFEISSGKYKKIENIAKQKMVTVYIILIAAYAILLSKHSNKDDVVIGSISAGRNLNGLSNLIGQFIRALPMRFNVNKEDTFEKFLFHVKDVVFGAYDNQEFMFDKIYEVNGKKIEDELFSTIVNYHMEAENRDEIKIGDLELEPYSLGQKVDSRRDIQLEIFSKKLGGLEISMEYNTKMFKRATMEKFVEHYQNILEFITYDVDKKISEINILSEKEKLQLLMEFNNTKVDYTDSKMFIDLFEEQVKKTPDLIAVKYMDKTLTYKQLDKMSNQLARALRSKNVKPNDVVGLMVERSTNMIVCVLGILKSGAAYMPIDSECPKNRKEYMLIDSKTEVFVTESKFESDSDFHGELIKIDQFNFNEYSNERLDLINNAKDLAYVIYTSGTTGNPKGVLVNHSNLANAALSWRHCYRLNEIPVKVLQVASISFDVFVGDLARTLINGGKMIICPAALKFDFSSLYKLILENNISLFESTPSLIIPFMDYIFDNSLEIPSLKLLIIGSDTCPIKDYKRIVSRFGNKVRVLNSYGVTEATIDSSYYEEEINNIPDIMNTPIGKPMPNVKFYILDEKYNLQPIGVPGELYIGGAGIACGYLNRHDLTEQKFVKDLINEDLKMYKTGDLARWLDDGNIEFLGRIDNQVKIRGFRIELGEIENILLEEKGIEGAVVIDRKDKDGDKYLCAYVSSSRTIDKDEILLNLSKKLPNYMIPTVIIQVEKFPITSNGKIDRKMLPNPKLEDINKREYVAPTNHVEEKLAEILTRILKIEKIGIEDDFFKLGGNSLKAIVAISNIHKVLNVKVPVKEIFSSPTIKHLANYILSTEKSNCLSIQKAEKMEYYPATSAQKRLYALCQFEKNNVSYNIPLIMVLDGYIDKDKVEAVFKDIIHRHETLRTSFIIMDEKLFQKIEENCNFNLYYTERKGENINSISNNFIKPFNLSKSPLIRVSLIKIEDNKHILMIDVHHILSDGISVNIILSEFIKLYNGEILLDLKLQYKDYAVWQEKLLKTEYYEKMGDYWIRCFSGSIPILNMPLDFQRPEIQSFAGDTVFFTIEGELRNELNKICLETGTTMYMVLFAVYNILLAYYSCQNDIIVGTPVSGRTNSDLEGIVGMFVNTLPIRSYPESSKTFMDFLLEEKETLLKAYEYQDYQLETLLEKLQIQRFSNRNPLFDVVFSYRDNKEKPLPLNGIKLNYYSIKDIKSKFDFSLNVTDGKKRIAFEIEYCTKLLKKDTMEKFAQHYIKIVNSIIQNRFIKIGNIEIEELSLQNNDIEDIEFNF